MPIIRSQKRENPFAQIDKRLLNDDRISWRAKGVACYLLSKPDGWSVRMEDIQKHGQEGRDALRAAMNELKAFGYAELRSTPMGKEWVVFEESKDPQPENPSMGQSLKFRTPQPEKPTPENPPLSNNEGSNNTNKNKVEEFFQIFSPQDKPEKTPTTDKPPKKESVNIPEALSSLPGFAEALAEWQKHRVKLRKPPTGYAVHRFLMKLAQNPSQALEAINMVIDRGWQSFEWHWINPRFDTQLSRNTSPRGENRQQPQARLNGLEEIERQKREEAGRYAR